MYRLLTLSLLLFTLVGCSSNSSDGRGGSGSSSSQSKNPPGENANTFLLGGAVTGLGEGQLILSNGLDQNYAIVVGDRPFQFPSAIPSGELYDIKIEAKPKELFCEVINSRNYLIRDTFNIRIACARAVSRKVEIAKPLHLSFGQLLLSSNYQRLGVNEDVPLSADENYIQVYNNSFVSLSVIKQGTNNAEPILLAHVHDMDEYLATPENLRSPLKIDVDSTVLALLMLEPTMATAIVERTYINGLSLPLKTVIDSFKQSIQSTDEYTALHDKIHSLIAAQQTLLNHNGELDEPLQALVHKGAEVLQNSIPLNLPQMIETDQLVESASGAATYFDIRSEPSGDSLVKSVNLGARSVVLQSDRFDPLILRGYETKEFTLSPGIGHQESLSIFINGAGSYGRAGEDRLENYYTSLLSGSLQSHFFTSLNLAIGVQGALQFSLSECLDADQYGSILSQGIQGANLHSLMVDGDVSSSQQFNGIFSALRDILLGNGQATALVEVIFACEKFGIGVYLPEKSQLAKQQVQSVYELAQALYGNDKNKLELFEYPNLTRFIKSLKSASRESIWTYSNELVLRLISSHNAVAPNQNVQFQAECLDPSQDNQLTPCEIAWAFGDGFQIPSQQLIETGIDHQEHSYPSEGTYNVEVKAKRPEGASVSQVLTLEVATPKPHISVRKLNSTPVDSGERIYNFGRVLIESTKVGDFLIANTGNADLIVSDIQLSNDSFSVDTTLPLTVGPSEDRRIEISFNPTRVQHYPSRLTIESNDAEQGRETITFDLFGEGYLPGEPAEGSWTIEGADVSEAMVVQRAKIELVADGGLLVRVFGHPTKDFPQVLINLPDYKGTSGTFSLDDTFERGCLGSVVFAGAANTYCTNTSTTVSRPISGSVTVEQTESAIRNLSYAFEAALNAVACGSVNVAECNVVVVEGEVIVP